MLAAGATAAGTGAGAAAGNTRCLGAVCGPCDHVKAEERLGKTRRDASKRGVITSKRGVIA